MSEVVYLVKMSISWCARREDQLRRAAPAPRLAEEVLLAGGADEVVVRVAVADVLERLVAAHPLVAGEMSISAYCQLRRRPTFEW